MSVCLGFDFGVKKIGVAVGDTQTGIANALTTIKAVNQKPNWQAIASLVEEWQPQQFIVGLSLQADGTKNPVTPRMIRFSNQLEGRFQRPSELFEEGLTTFEAKQLLYDEHQVSANKLWEVQDQLAAQLILQGWLDSQKQQKG